MLAGTFSNMACRSLAKPVERRTPESADASENLHFATITRAVQHALDYENPLCRSGCHTT